MTNITETLAGELNARPQQVAAAVKLLDDGATVPFIARYRKEVTGGLDDGQLRTLEQRLGYLRELEDRRQVILSSIEEQGKLTAALRADIVSAETKTRLEDLYLPYKPKRRTRGEIAKEAGLEPLADQLFNDPSHDPEQLAARYLNPDQKITDTKAALDGARYILMERFAEQASVLERLRTHMMRHGHLHASVVAGKEQEGAKFADYFEHDELFSKIPSHRALAMFRGRNEGILQLKLLLPDDVEPAEPIIAALVGVADQGRPADTWLQTVITWTWRVKLQLQIETDLLGQLRERAETDAIAVFANNLRDLLMAAPAGPRPTLGLDPGLRTGVKVAVVDATGKLVATDTIYPHAPRNQWQASLATLAKLCQRHHVELVAIGNGTASRETDKLAAELLAQLANPQLHKIMVSEAGASVYSASELAAQEFPELDVSLRGAVSIARRLQDPLAELVKIDPKSIGVGQYQHDVSQLHLAHALDATVEDCVNAVGVDLNMASAPLLTRVAGLNKNLAEQIIVYRDEQGAFVNRKQLLKVPRLGPKTFEQCAGFLRIRNGENPLDNSAVHPERYQLVEQILQDLEQPASAVIGASDVLHKLDTERYINEDVGLPTLRDIISELEKPGRDPRPAFQAATFKEGVETLNDLEPDMVLEGVVTNVTHFGAFVDIGVHQDGLVHISALSNRFVEDPRTIVKAGDVVKVKVMDVDIPRKRIALSMRLDDQAAERQVQQGARGSNKPSGSGARANKGQSRDRSATSQKTSQGTANNAMASAFADALKRGR